MPERRSTADLPRPLSDGWPRSLAPAAEALWNWHASLTDPMTVGGDGTVSMVDGYFDDERERAENAEPMRMVREEVWRRAYAAVEQHDLDRSLLASQVDAARRLHGAVRFETASDLETFVRAWAVPHARLLAGLAGAARSWQVPYVDELARGFFYAGRLMCLPGDLGRGRLFVPLSDLQQHDVDLDDLREGTVSEQVRRVLWKQSIRVRDALGQGQPLLKELPFRYRINLKRWWLGALEVLNELERRDYDLWSQPLELPAYRRFQVYLQTVFGRASTS